MLSIENQTNKILNKYLHITKDLSLSKICALNAVELIMENCKNNKIYYWQCVKKEISQFQLIIFKDLKKYNKDNMPI